MSNATMCQNVGLLGIFQNIGPWEIVIILAVILLLFGGKKLPELARGLGRGMRLFKEELSGVSKQLQDEDKPKPPAEQAKPSGPNDGNQQPPA